MATQVLQQPASSSTRQLSLHLTGPVPKGFDPNSKITVSSRKRSFPFSCDTTAANNPHIKILGAFTSPWSLNFIIKPDESGAGYIAPRVKAYIDETKALDAGSRCLEIADKEPTRDEREIPGQVLTMIQRLRDFDE
ncbi:MAG: hypothetical protein Q9160_000174, partial [Pyrenula sp. 1 TL-2023]